MPQPRVFKANVWESTGPTLLARIKNSGGSNAVIADITSISYVIRDVCNPTVDVSTGTLTPSLVMFNTLQTDPIWTADSTGYNFRWSLVKTQIPDPEHYRVEIKFTPLVGEQFYLVYLLNVMEILSA